MNYNKCRTCENYDRFFNACNQYILEVYLDDGDFDTHYVDIKK